jgi:hypothetical protein
LLAVAVSITQIIARMMAGDPKPIIVVFVLRVATGVLRSVRPSRVRLPPLDAEAVLDETRAAAAMLVASPVAVWVVAPVNVRRTPPMRVCLVPALLHDSLT